MFEGLLGICMKKCCIHQYLNKYTFVPIFLLCFISLENPMSVLALFMVIM